MNESLSFGGRRVAGFALADGSKSGAPSVGSYLASGAIAAVGLGLFGAGASYVVTGKANRTATVVSALLGATLGGVVPALLRPATPAQ